MVEATCHYIKSICKLNKTGEWTTHCSKPFPIQYVWETRKLCPSNMSVWKFDDIVVLTSHRINVWYIYLHEGLIFYGKCVGKSTSPVGPYQFYLVELWGPKKMAWNKGVKKTTLLIPWEPTTFIFRGYNPYIGGVKRSFFMVLGSKGRDYFTPFITGARLVCGYFFSDPPSLFRTPKSSHSSTPSTPLHWRNGASNLESLRDWWDLLEQKTGRTVQPAENVPGSWYRKWFSEGVFSPTGMSMEVIDSRSL